MLINHPYGKTANDIAAENFGQCPLYPACSEIFAGRLQPNDP